jgi:hypothetical protein
MDCNTCFGRFHNYHKRSQKETKGELNISVLCTFLIFLILVSTNISQLFCFLFAIKMEMYENIAHKPLYHVRGA